MDAFLLVGQSNMAGRGNIPQDTNQQQMHTPPYTSTNIYDNNNTLRTIVNGHEILSFDIMTPFNPTP